MNHTIAISVDDTGDLWLTCSCGWEQANVSALLNDLIDLARQHMEETFPLRLIEEMNRPARISAKDLGLSNYEFIQALSKRDPS